MSLSEVAHNYDAIDSL